MARDPWRFPAGDDPDLDDGRSLWEWYAAVEETLRRALNEQEAARRAARDSWARATPAERDGLKGQVFRCERRVAAALVKTVAAHRLRDRFGVHSPLIDTPTPGGVE